MGLTSWEEDEILETAGWWKNLIKRQWEYETPTGAVIALGFDDIMEMSQGEAGEKQLVHMAKAIPEKVCALQLAPRSYALTLTESGEATLS